MLSHKILVTRRIMKLLILVSIILGVVGLLLLEFNLFGFGFVSFHITFWGFVCFTLCVKLIFRNEDMNPDSPPDDDFLSLSFIDSMFEFDYDSDSSNSTDSNSCYGGFGSSFWD